MADNFSPNSARQVNDAQTTPSLGQPQLGNEQPARVELSREQPNVANSAETQGDLAETSTARSSRSAPVTTPVLDSDVLEPSQAASPKHRFIPNQRFSWNLMLSTVLLSLPLVIGVAALSLWLKQPLVGVLLGSVITAFVSAMAARRRQVPIALQQGFNYDELDLLEVENNRLSAQLMQVTQQQNCLTKRHQFLSLLAFRVRQMPEFAVLFDTLVTGVRELLETDRVVVYRFNPDWSGTIVAESVDARFPASLNQTIGDPCFHERHAAQYKNGRTSAVDDIYQASGLTDCYINLLEQYRVRANLVVPIRQGDRLFGLLIAHHCRGPRHWSEDDLGLMNQVTTEAEYHLEFLVQNRQQQMGTKRAWFLGDIAFRARQTTDLDDLFRTTVKGLRQLIGADRVMVYRFNPDWSGYMVAESVAAEFTPVLNEHIDDPCFRGRYVDMYRNGRVRGINNIREEPGLTECHIRLLEKYEVKANLVAPLRLGEKLFGLLIAHQCSAPRVWQEDELSCLSQTAVQLEYATEHLHSIQTIKQSLERTQLFGDIAFRTRQSQGRAGILNVVMQGGLKQLNTDRMMVYRFNPDWSGTMIAEAVSSERWPKVLDTKIFDPCFKGRYVDLYQNGRVRAMNDITQEPGLSDCHIRTLQQYDVKANLVAPIRLKGRLYGLLIAHHCESPREWSKADTNFISELATQTEYALEHLAFIDDLEAAQQKSEQVSIEQHQRRETLQHQLEEVRQSLQAAFDGDLRIRAALPAGEISVFTQFLNDSIGHLQQIVQTVKMASATVTKTALDSERSVSKLSSATLMQSSKLATALEMVETSAVEIQQVAEYAQSAHMKVQQADQIFQAGDQAMDRTADAIALLQSKVDDTAQQIKRLGEASQNISRVINLIRDLAGQTNVLALNASIEANSSGDQSQGFEVVAEEVRSLAERSTAATREIEGLVEEIQTETNQVVSAMESWDEEVSASTELVEIARSRLNSISSFSGEIRVLVETIAQSAGSHAQSSASVSNTMQTVGQIAQQNSQLSTTLTESFNELLAVAQRLESQVKQFKV